MTKVSSLSIEERPVNIIADFNESLDGLTPPGDGDRVESQVIVQEIAGALLRLT